MQVAVWAASLGATSSNLAGIHVASRWLEQTGESVIRVSGLEAIPPFQAEQVDTPPSMVADYRSQIESGDAVLIAAPEYAGGLAGAAKNALDWLVGSGSLYHRVVGVLSVGTTGGVFAREQLIRTLSWQGAITVASLGVHAPRTKMVDGVFTDEPTIDAIEGWAADVVIAHGLSQTDRVAKAKPLLAPLGIDVARFG